MKHPLFQSLSAALLLLALCACTAASPDQTPNPPPETAEPVETEPVLVERDWSAFFQGMQGCAVIYDPQRQEIHVFQPSLAETRRSPCSTFKIVSAFAALVAGVLQPEDSTRAWSGEVFWNDEWNRDLDFSDAFHSSCVWYFRQLIDELGPERMQQAVDRLQYGNCDLSDWSGARNQNNNNPALTGFWIESSLAISPREQTEVMARIFGGDGSQASRQALEEVMAYNTDTPYQVYGKTGMGKVNGVVVDAWFTGFARQDDASLYFCVWLGQSEGASSPAAREIALDLLAQWYAAGDS